ncbi:3-oxoacyl-ACP reductase [Alicyclobacillus cellulosilyticus]|uniref:3-oxoacyl-ACP reductase n=2 Tax=Alicyclobacillus cellulosilyticus TaxID=1003997 RepID=A0A917NIK2_9BACL|nr:3-oxoacyl-ACP reductase [Alicyclobacillus cellulosilyticus]
MSNGTVHDKMAHEATEMAHEPGMAHEPTVQSATSQGFMAPGLRGKVVLVTGASRGIGRAVALAFAAHGAFVAVNYLSRADLAAAVVDEARRLGGDGMAVQADVRQRHAVARMVAEVVAAAGRIDVVVNNALTNYRFDPKQRQLAWETGWPQVEAQVAASLGAVVHMAEAVLPYMQAQASGRIIHIVSNLVDFPLVPYHDYTAAKAAVVGYSRSLAAEVGRFGITVNCVAPGLTVPTDASRPTKEDVREQVIRLTPMGRLVTPDDVAGAVLFLASDWARMVTGQCLRVDGGLVMRD